MIDVQVGDIIIPDYTISNCHYSLYTDEYIIIFKIDNTNIYYNYIDRMTAKVVFVSSILIKDFNRNGKICPTQRKALEFRKKLGQL